MNVIPLAARRHLKNPPAPFVEVLTCASCSETLGYAFAGETAGPIAALISDAALIEALAARLGTLPTLPWMRGRLILLCQDAVEGHRTNGLKETLADLQFDEAILLPYRASLHVQSIDDAYWTTLRLAQGLGMIAGRGIPYRMPMLCGRAV